MIAQDVEQVIPGSVGGVTIPAQIGEDGQETAPSHTIKLLNYDSFIPLLIAAVKEQQVHINALESQLDACCAGGEGMMPDGNDGQGSTGDPTDLEQERLLISPNPFSTATTVSYYVPVDGRVKLEVSTSEGRALKVLREEETSAGEHKYDWNTSSLAAGTYFVALVVDENVIVKRAVKVHER